MVSLEDVLLSLFVLPTEQEDEFAVPDEQRHVVPVLLCKKEEEAEARLMGCLGPLRLGPASYSY